MEGNFVKIVFASLLHEVYSKRKEFAPIFFSFRVDLFQKGLDVKKSKQEVTEVISLVKNGRKSAKCI